MLLRFRTAMFIGLVTLVLVTLLLFTSYVTFFPKTLKFKEYVYHPIRHYDVEKYSSDTEVLLSVKTTTAYHKPRLGLLLKTWLQTINPNQVRIVTDSETDEWTQKAQDMGIPVINTMCPEEHVMASLCCKSGHEYEQYYEAFDNGIKYRWFCHFDDDEYVNVDTLLRTLRQYDPQRQMKYLGHWPLRNGKERMNVGRLRNFENRKRDSYYYATGAAYCVSASLMMKLKMFFRGSMFVDTCLKVFLTDDVAVGAIIEGVLGYDLTEVSTMLSQVEDLTKITPDRLKDLITVGFKLKFQNRVLVPNSTFSAEDDPTGFLSYHCYLHPTTLWCNPAAGQSLSRV